MKPWHVGACPCCDVSPRGMLGRRRFLQATGFGAVGLSLGARRAAAASVPEIPYMSVANLLHLPPDRYLGEVSGVATNSAGYIFVFSRGNSDGAPYGAAMGSVRNGSRPYHNCKFQGPRRRVGSPLTLQPDL